MKPPRHPSRGMPGFEVICSQGGDPKVVLTWQEALAAMKKGSGRCRIRPARASTLNRLERKLRRQKRHHLAKGNHKPQGCGCGG